MGWFGECVAQWCHLRSLIHEPFEQTPKAQKHKLGFINKGHLCAVTIPPAHVEGAVISGKRVAEAIIMRR